MVTPLRGTNDITTPARKNRAAIYIKTASTPVESYRYPAIIGEKAAKRYRTVKRNPRLVAAVCCPIISNAEAIISGCVAKIKRPNNPIINDNWIPGD